MECPFSTSEERQIVQHLKQHYSRKATTSLNNGNEFGCQKCSFKSTNRLEIREHLLGHTINNECLLCRKKFTDAELLAGHMLQHDSNAENRCDICRQTFLQLDSLLFHRKFCLLKQRYGCRFCEKQFYCLISRQQHEASHITDACF